MEGLREKLFDKVIKLQEETNMMSALLLMLTPLLKMVSNLNLMMIVQMKIPTMIQLVQMVIQSKLVIYNVINYIFLLIKII